MDMADKSDHAPKQPYVLHLPPLPPPSRSPPLLRLRTAALRMLPLFRTARTGARETTLRASSRLPTAECSKVKLRPVVNLRLPAPVILRTEACSPSHLRLVIVDVFPHKVTPLVDSRNALTPDKTRIHKRVTRTPRALHVLRPSNLVTLIRTCRCPTFFWRLNSPLKGTSTLFFIPYEARLAFIHSQTSGAPILAPSVIPLVTLQEVSLLVRTNFS